eukprot:1842045-Pyramimonas_sp.AAC.1
MKFPRTGRDGGQLSFVFGVDNIRRNDTCAGLRSLRVRPHYAQHVHKGGTDGKTSNLHECVITNQR